MSEDIMKQIEETRAKHEFLTFLFIKDSDDWKCGVVQNSNNRFITIYDIAKIKNKKHLNQFLSFADRWWWESGRTIPIDCFIGSSFDVFQDTLTILPKKTLSQDPVGPVYSITENYLKRIKKRRIDFVARKQKA